MYIEQYIGSTFLVCILYELEYRAAGSWVRSDWVPSLPVAILISGGGGLVGAFARTLARTQLVDPQVRTEQ